MRHRTRHLLGLLVPVSLALAVGVVGPVIASDRVVRVRPGDTLSGIAARTGIPLERIVRLNHLRDPDRILVGQRIRLRPAPDRGRGAARHHRVVPGETLSSIALRYGTSVEAIARANGLRDPSFVRAGTVLRIPGAHRSATRQARRAGAGHGRTAVRYRVVWGDSLSGIAVRFGTSVTAIVRANALRDPSRIYAGMVLRVPAARRTGAGSSSGGRHAARNPAPATLIRRTIVREARRQGVPEALALALAWQESGWQQHVVSSAGAIGVMQLLPSTGEWVASAFLGEPVNLWRPRSNVRAGIALLRFYLHRYGSRELALAAYYQGMTAVDLHGVYSISWPYISSVLALERRFRA